MKTLGTIQADANAEVYAVATGALPDGKPVIVNSNGTVSVVASTTVTEALGSAVAFESGDSRQMGGAFDSTNNKVVLVYADVDNSSYGTAVVGTVSGTSISFGTPVVYNSASSQYDKAAFDTNSGKVLIGYRDQGDSSNGNARVGTVSGTSISFGTEATFTTGAVEYLDMTFDSTNNKVVLVYTDAGNGDDGFASVATISGTSVSFGTAVEFSGNNNTAWNVCGFDSTNGKVVIAYEDASDSGKLKSVVGTVSGTSISFGSVATVDSNATERNGLAAVGNGKVVVGYTDEDTSSRLFGAVGTISGTSISYGTRVSITSDSTGGEISVGYDSAADTVIFAYADGGDGNKGKYTPATVSGTSLSLGSEVIFETASVSSSDQTFQTYDSNSEKIVISYRDGDNSGAGTAIVLQPGYTGTNLTTENFLGFTGGEVTYDIVSETLGSASVFESASTSAISATFDSNLNKTVFVYADSGNSNYATAVVGTVSGTSISFGTPVVFDSGDAGVLAATFDSSSNKVVAVFKANSDSDKGKAIVGTVSGTGISFGSVVVFESSAIGNGLSATFDTNSNRVVIAYLLVSNYHGKSIVGTVSNTSISFGSTVTFESASTGLGMGNITFDSSNNKVVIAYVDGGDGSKGKAIVGTVSNTSISFGTAAVFETGSTADTAITFDASNNKVVVAFRDAGDSNKGKSAVGTVSGTDISFGTAVIFKETQVREMVLSYNSAAAKVVLIYYAYAGTGYGEYIVGTVSGTSIGFSSISSFNTANTSDSFITYDSNSKVNVIAYKDEGNSNHGTAKVYQAGYDNTTRGEIADGKTATIQVGGSINTQQNALTAGQQYFVQTDGTIDLTAASPSVIAGTAVSATDLIVKG